jgi:hypothetical protein
MGFDDSKRKVPSCPDPLHNWLTSRDISYQIFHLSFIYFCNLWRSTFFFPCVISVKVNLSKILPFFSLCYIYFVEKYEGKTRVFWYILYLEEIYFCPLLISSMEIQLKMND